MPGYFYFLHSINASLPACQRQTADITSMLTPGENPSPEWLSAHTLCSHGLMVSSVISIVTTTARHTENSSGHLGRGCGCRPKWHLLFMRKNHSLGFSGRSKFPAAPPPPAQAAPPPARPALFIHWLSIFQPGPPQGSSSRGGSSSTTGWLMGTGRCRLEERHLFSALQFLICFAPFAIKETSLSSSFLTHTHSLCSDATGLPG